MSASGAYRPPKVTVHTYGDEERRSDAPLNQLGRDLNAVCLEASDRFEIAAHLEALGYNGDGVAGRYGAQDHFELAERLYDATPKFLRLRRPADALKGQGASKQLIMVLTLLVASSIGLLTEVNAWGAVFWLLIWSQLGGALLNRAKVALGPSEQAHVTSLVLELGFAGLLVAWALSPFALATWTVSLLWLGVAGLLWDERLSYARLLPLTAAFLLCLHVWAGLSLTFMLAGTGLATLVALRPLLVWSTPRNWRWALGQWAFLAPFVLYGIGQGLLLMALLRGSSSEAIPGLALFAVILLFAEPQLLRLRASLKDYLWRESSTGRYAVLARRAITFYAARYLLAFVPALALWLGFGEQTYMWFHLAGFALFGTALALGLVSLSIGDNWVPSLIFAAGGGLVVLGLPLLLTLALIIAAEFAVLLRRTHYLGRYGIYFL